GNEGAFLACSFWLADNYILQGRYADARLMFERLLDLRNDVGLLAEEYDPRARRQVGNFPQAFSHVALINTAHNLTRAYGPAQHRAESKEAASSAASRPARRTISIPQSFAAEGRAFKARMAKARQAGRNEGFLPRGDVNPDDGSVDPFLQQGHHRL